MKKWIPVFVVLLWACAAVAVTADDISKEVNSKIREAENAFFAGNVEDAAKLLEAAQAKLKQLKNQDASHRSLKTLETKHDRLKSRIDQKLDTSTPVTKSSTASRSPAKTEEKNSLSTGAKNNLEKAGRDMDAAEQEIAKGEKSLQAGQFNLVESYVFNADNKLKDAALLLERVVKSNKADPDHPDVIAATARRNDIAARLNAFNQKARGDQTKIKEAAAEIQKEEKELNEKWLPRLAPFTDSLSDSRLQYPGSYDTDLLAKQELLYRQAREVLSEAEKSVPADRQPHELKQAMEKLNFALQVYDDQKIADGKNRMQPIADTLSSWENRFDDNQKWDEDSDMGLFIITPEKLEYQKKQIAEFSKADPDGGKQFSRQLQKLEQENVGWTEKKKKWIERPRPFPKAKMTDTAMEKDMQKLLKNRGIEVKDLVITDKDWWVQPGEFRYLNTAVLSKGKNGEYWFNASFRQMQTLTGYTATEIWDIQDIRISLP